MAKCLPSPPIVGWTQFGGGSNGGIDMHGTAKADLVNTQRSAHHTVNLEGINDVPDQPIFVPSNGDCGWGSKGNFV